MSLASVKAFFAERAPDIAVLESEQSSATVALAALAFGVAPGMIAKTLALRVGERTILLVARGDRRLDNKKFKAQFGAKPRMLEAEETVRLTSHPLGGVCPFGLASPLAVFCDTNLADFAEVVPAAGSTNSAVRIAPERLAELTAATWVDVCEDASPSA